MYRDKFDLIAAIIQKNPLHASSLIQDSFLNCIEDSALFTYSPEAKCQYYHAGSRQPNEVHCYTRVNYTQPRTTSTPSPNEIVKMSSGTNVL